MEDAYQEYMKLDRDLDRLKGSIQAIEYCAYGKMPGDGNHDKFKNHKRINHKSNHSDQEPPVSLTIA